MQGASQQSPSQPAGGGAVTATLPNPRPYPLLFITDVIILFNPLSPPPTKWVLSPLIL